MSLLLLMNDHIYKSTLVYSNLNDNIEKFEYEAMVLDYVKCILINEQELDDFSIEGYDVYIDADGSSYILHSSIEDIEIYVEDRMISDFKRI